MIIGSIYVLKRAILARTYGFIWVLVFGTRNQTKKLSFRNPKIIFSFYRVLSWVSATLYCTWNLRMTAGFVGKSQLDALGKIKLLVSFSWAVTQFLFFFYAIRFILKFGIHWWIFYKIVRLLLHLKLFRKLRFPVPVGSSVNV